MSIPKVIHYCWFGRSSKSEEILDCIQSWRRILPDYEIREWNEDNYKSDSFFYKQCIRKKKYAFASDFARFDILSNYGGIYLDVDMLMLKSINPLLNSACFLGYESENVASCGIIASEKNHPFTTKVLADLKKVNDDDYFQFYTIIKVVNKLLQEMETNELPVIYPVDYFYAYPFHSTTNLENHLTANSYAIHLWNASWFNHFHRAILYYDRGQKKKGRVLFMRSLLTNPLNIRFLYRFLY